MARTFLLGLIVAVLLGFAITDGSRGQTNQVNGQKIQNRGTTRYQSEPTTESNNFPVLTTTSPRDKSSRSETVSDLARKHETHLARKGSIKTQSNTPAHGSSAVSSRTNVNRHANLSIDNVRNRSKSQAPNGETTRDGPDDDKENAPELPKRQTASRRASSETSTVRVDGAKLDPEVFTKSPDYSRSRTGRKIYTSVNGKESNDQAVPPRKFVNENAENVESSKNGSEKEKARIEHSIEDAVSRANTSRKTDTRSTNGSGNRKDGVKEERDVLLSGSESVRVDIPLAVGNDEGANLLTSTTLLSVNTSSRQQTPRPVKKKTEGNDIAKSNAKKSRQSDRSESRARSSDPNFNVINVSRRGTSKFGATVSPAETSERSSGSRHRSGTKGTRTKSRGRSAHKSKDTATEAKGSVRSRITDTDLETSGRAEKRRTPSNDRRTSEGKRRSSDARSKTVTETRTNEQDVRAQTRGRSRPVNGFDVTTAYIPKATIAEATTISSADTEITTSSPVFVTTRTSIATRVSSTTERASRNKGRDRGENARTKKPPREDFFNHGLGFRGRKSDGQSSYVTDVKSTTAKSETQLHGNPGWTLRRRPSHVNDDVPSSIAPTSINRDQTNEIVLSNDSSTSTETSLSNAKTGRRGTKRPKVKDESNTVSGITAKSVTRGSKTFNKFESFGLPKRIELEESDNYPPAFRARLNQLKNSNLKPTEAKSTIKPHLQEQPREHTFRRHIRSSTKPMHVSEKIETVGNAFATDVILDVDPTNPLTSILDPDTRHATKSSAATLFSERSKMKLDLARRLIKPELNVDGNEFDVTTAPYSGKSKAKEVTTVGESRNVEKATKVTKVNSVRVPSGSLVIDNEEKEKSRARARWKFLESRKSLKDRNLEVSSRSPAITTRKSRVTTKKTSASSSTRETPTRSSTEFHNVTSRGMVSHRDTVSTEVAATTINATKLPSPVSQSTATSREEASTLVETVDNSIVTTIEPIKLDKASTTTSGLEKQESNDVYDAQKKPTTVTTDIASMTNASESTKIYTTQVPQEVTLSPPTITTFRSAYSSVTVTPEKVYPVYIPDAREKNLSENKEKARLSDDATKSNTFRPRYTKQEQPDKVAVSMVVSRTVGPTSRYIRKKSGVFTPYDATKSPSTEPTLTQTKRKEFRPRTATYRRHSEMPTSQLIQQTTANKEAINDITITPKPNKYHAQIVTPSTRSSFSQPSVSVTIDTSNNTTPFVPGIITSDNGNSNIFNPASSTFLSAGNTSTLLEQLRSTVAPLLNSLGDKTPVFSGAYSNVDTRNSAPRITPNGSPPRFSARYKGAELFVRKPSIGQVVPSITTSSTTASTPLENSGSAPPVDIDSPSEPRFVTFYRALESASIRNENLGVDDVSQQLQTLTDGVTKVDSNATVVPNGASNNTANNNDTATSPNATITTTSSSDTTVTDISTTAVQPANISLSSTLGTENSPNDMSETASMTVETPANPDPNRDTTPFSINMNDTTSAPTSESPGINNAITSTPIMQPFMESISDVQSTEYLMDRSTTTVPIIETTNTNMSMFASQNLQMSRNMSNTTISSPSFKNITLTRVSSEMTTAMNDASEDVETNTVRQSDETTARTTDVPINGMLESVVTSTEQQLDQFQTVDSSTTEIDSMVEDIEINTIQQSDTTIPAQMTETTSTTEPITTEEMSNDIIQTQTPIVTSTFRTRIIDYAQDILLRLRNNLPTTEAPIQKPITTTISSQLSNAIPDSLSMNAENPARIQDTTTVQQVESGNIEATTISQLNIEAATDQSTDVESIQTTTTVTNGSTQGMIIQNTIGLNMPESSAEQRLSNNVNAERNATLNSDSMMSTQDTRNLGDSSIDADIVTTTSMPNSQFVDFVTENDPSSSSNDTLLTELMTIAKNLFSEAMNDTRQSSFMPSQISDFEATTVPDVSNLFRANGTIENDDKNQVTSNASERITVSSVLPITLENITERTNIAMFINLSEKQENETRENSNRAPMVGSEISLMEFNTRPTESPVDVGDMIAIPETSLSQIKTETPNTITPSISFELTTNIPETQSSNPTQSTDNNSEQNVLTIDSAQNQFTTLPNNNVKFTMDLTTNNPSTVNSITVDTTEMLTNLDESTNVPVGLTTNVAITEVNIVQMNDTNQITRPITIKPASDPINDQFLIMNAPSITSTPPMVSDDNATDTQPFSTEPPATESVRNLVSSIETTVNQFNDITTNAPQMITNLVNETPNIIARFQDTTTATTTAQRTAGSSTTQPEQTTETTTIPIGTAPTLTIFPTSSESFIINMTSTPSPSVQTTSATVTTTEGTITTTAIPVTTSIRLSSEADLTTTASLMPKTTVSTVDINENLISTEATTDTPITRGTTVIPGEADNLNAISRMSNEEIMTTTMSTTTPTTTAAPTSTTSATTTSTTQATMSNGAIRPVSISTVPYFGRFDSSQITTAARSKPNSSGRAPVRDYLIYGIYPNKTIVRKRPEDNLIDPRNVDSPYVIFGIYPDGRLVRKYPNGTIIPDSPRNPVEVVFTLSTTTTTNRPAPRPFYNQANQAVTYNQYQAPVYYNNRRPMDELTVGDQNRSPIDFGLTGNAIGVPPAVGPIFAGPFGPSASVPSTNKMNDILLNTQTGTLPNAASTIGNVPNTNNIQLQGPIGSIVQDRDMSEASRTRVTSDQRSSVYIGQDKFINYQINGASNINPKVVDVRINSVATSVNEGTASSTASIPSFENLLNNQSGNGGVITAPPGFPWRDPLDQIFGITTNSPMQTASVASNRLDEPPESNVSIMPRLINPQVEIFTPITSGTNTPNSGPTTTSITSSPPTTASIAPITNATTSTTTPASTTTAATTTTTTTTMTTTTTTTTTTSTTPAPTTTTTSQPTITPSTTSSTAPSTTVRLATTASSIIAKAVPQVITSSPSVQTLSANDVLNGLQANTKENTFGTTFDDLAFLNSLLQNNNVKPTTPNTLSEVEQILANRILALALATPGPPRSPKAIQDTKLNTNLYTIKDTSPSDPSSKPIIIDLLPYSSATLNTPTTRKQLETSTAASKVPTRIITTRAPVVITAKPKTTARPKSSTTTKAPVGFGMNLWQALFGNNLFATTTAASVKQKPKTASPKPVQVTQKPVTITQKPVQTVKSTTYTSHIMSAIPNKSPSPTTRRSVDIADIQVSSTASFTDNIGSASVSTPNSISSTTLLNNPNPRLTDISTSTYSPEDDAKFLAALLRAIQAESETSTSTTSTSTTTQRAITVDDEAFLRAILSQQRNILSTTTASSTEVNSAALLALLLKQQGIEPPTPATNLREQLQLASLGIATQLQPDRASTTRPITTTTTTNRPIVSPTIQLAIGTTKKVTPKPSPRSRLQTTTWSPSSTYPPPLFGQNSGSGLATATRIFGQFLGAAISGAAKQFQSFLRNGTTNVIG